MALGINYPVGPRLVFREGALDSIGELVKEYGGHSVLLVSDGGLIRAGHADRAAESLKRAKVDVHVFGKVRENPTTRDVAECVAEARLHEIDFIVGLGGGSSLDTAKGANFILTNGGTIADYRGFNKASRALLPFVAIPTTAGTGSECQCFALIADEFTHQKMACGDEQAYARVALLDPLLTLSLPWRVTANAGIDTVTHALESYVTSARTTVSQSFSRETWSLAESNLSTVLDEPTNIGARGRMLLASAYGGTAIAQSMLGAAHSAANPLTARFNLVHGQAVGIMLPHVIRFNCRDPQVLASYIELAVTTGLARRSDDPEQSLWALLTRIAELLDSARIPDGLRDCGVSRGRIPEMAAEAMREWTAGFNPVRLAVNDFSELYAAACESRRELFDLQPLVSRPVNT